MSFWQNWLVLPLVCKSLKMARAIVVSVPVGSADGLHQSRRLRRSPLPLEVETPAGTVRGYADRVKGARTFLGVPFAAPPLGHLRFAY